MSVTLNDLDLSSPITSVTLAMRFLHFGLWSSIHSKSQQTSPLMRSVC